jgi:uncharacterized membrane protein
MPRGGPAWTRARWLAAGTAALLYAGGSHYLMTRAGDSAWSLAIVLGPLGLLAVAGLWRTGRRAAALACAVAALLLAGGAAAGGGIPPRFLYLGQHAGIHLLLAASFGLTLRPGARALITLLAERVQGSLAPAEAAYTRRVTQAWVVYFLAMAAASLALFAAGDFERWALLANVLTPLFTVAMFVGEYALRYRLHPEFERVTLRMCIEAYRSHPGGGASPR